MLFIGEPLKEYVATIQRDGDFSNTPLVGFAGDVVPNMASYTRMAATQFGVGCTIDVLTAIGPEGDAPSDNALADLQARDLHLHPYTKRLPGKELGTVINLKNTDGSPSQEKVRLERRDSAFRDLLNDATSQDLATITDGYTHIVVSGTSLACIRERAKLVAVLQAAKKNDPPPLLIVTTNLRPPNWQMPDAEHGGGLSPGDPRWGQKARHWLNAIIQLADIVFANFTDERNLRGCQTPHEVGDTLRLLRPEAELIITNDAEPILAIYRDGDVQRSICLSVHPAPKVVDTVGAGDAFAGTYVAARMAGHSAPDAAEWALTIASQVIGFDGALPRSGASLKFATRTVDAPRNSHPL
jgi:2-dehydro-3-deoxygluconokinase